MANTDESADSACKSRSGLAAVSKVIHFGYQVYKPITEQVTYLLPSAHSAEKRFTPKQYASCVALRATSPCESFQRRLVTAKPIWWSLQGRTTRHTQTKKSNHPWKSQTVKSFCMSHPHVSKTHTRTRYMYPLTVWGHCAAFGFETICIFFFFTCASFMCPYQYQLLAFSLSIIMLCRINIICSVRSSVTFQSSSTIFKALKTCIWKDINAVISIGSNLRRFRLSPSNNPTHDLQQCPWTQLLITVV